MIFEHLRLRRHMALLAAGALGGREERAAQAHVQTCTRCRTEFLSLRAVVERVAQDPVHAAEPELPLAVLAARVQARLDEPRTTVPAVRGWRLAPMQVALAAAAVLVAGLLVPRGRAWLSIVPGTGRGSVAELPQVPEESLERLDRTLAREQTARYLNEAQDVLVTVAATPPHCKRGHEQLDMADEARRSRALLQRRALYTDLADEHAPSAEPVLHDVERVLREVAALDDCAHPEDLEAIHHELTEGRLLMKLTLVQRELVG